MQRIAQCFEYVFVPLCDKAENWRILTLMYTSCCRYQWPRGQRHRSAAARLLRLWVRIPSGAWISVCCDCCTSWFKYDRD